MKKHFVIFFSPGTFVSESTEKEIDEWDVDKAIKISKNIKERYGAIPYGFYFVTKGRNKDELDSKVITKSNMYYLNGEIFTLAQIKKRNDPKDKILISNMEVNKINKVIINSNSYTITLPFYKGDVILKI